MINTVYNRKDMILFTILNKRIVMILALLLMLPWFSGLHAQADDEKEYLTVIVKDAKTKQPIEAAQANTIRYSSAGTSDENGVMKIYVYSFDDLLEVRAYDYDTQEVPIRGKKEIEVYMYSNFFTPQLNLEEGISKKDRSTQNIYGTKNYTKRTSDFYIAADDFLRLNVGGEVRMIERSGVSGIGADMFIRGLNSINLYAQPLLIIDGVIVNNSLGDNTLHAGFYLNRLADMSIYDIKSITVLKDATSVYGSKGANGVIDIRTKRGESVVTKISFNASAGITDVAGKTTPMLSGDEYRVYASELMETLVYDYDYYKEYVPQVDEFLNDDPNGVNYRRYHNNTDWRDYVYQKGIVQNYHINVDGGDDMALYSLSVGYTGESGVVKTTEMQRLNTLFNADFFLTDYIEMGLNVGFGNVDRHLLDDGSVYHTSPTYLAMIKSPFLNPYTFTSAGTETADYADADVFGVSNPAAVIGYALNINKHYRLNFGVEPKFKILPTLTLSTLFDYSLDKMKETYYSPMLGVQTRYIEGYGYSNNMFQGQVARNVALYDDTKLRYLKNIDNTHSIDATLGWRYHSEKYKLEYGEGHNSGSDQRRNLLKEEEYKRITGENNSYKYISTYFHGEYDYKKRYFVGVTAAMDASSRFGVDTEGGFKLFNKKWGVFPGVQAGWLISSEEFMANVNAINHLKLKAGYSVSGNDALNPYAAYSYLSSEQYMSRANGLVIGSIGNSAIQWETTYKSNVGLDLSLLNNRASISVDGYYNTTKDLVVMKEYPEMIGNGFYWKNEGSLENIGGEVSLSLKVLNLRDVKWEVGANIGHYKNKITDLPSGEFTTNIFDGEILTREGEAAGLFYGYKVKRVIEAIDNEYLSNALFQVNQVTGQYEMFGMGDIEFEDVDNNFIIDSKDKQIIGDPNPDFYGSFNTRIGVKRLTLSALFTYSYGNDIYNQLRSTLESGKNFRNQSSAMLNRWTSEGQNTLQPRVAYGDPMGNSRFSDRWIEDGSYLKLKNITLSYNLPIGTKALESVEIWASGSNLFTWTGYLGQDPEVTAGKQVLYQGIDLGLLPNVRTMMVGVKLNL